MQSRILLIIMTSILICFTGCRSKNSSKDQPNPSGSPTNPSESQINPTVDPIDSTDLKEESDDTPAETEADGTQSTTYETITSEKAHEIITKQSNLVILDVRTEEEYKSGHIPDALLLPYDEINDQAENILTNKDQIILVYCRTGRRSAIAASDLAALGYTKVYDFGGIVDWPYEVVTE